MSSTAAVTARSRMRRSKRARMLAAAALTGAAALLAACSAQPGAPTGSPTAPTPPTSGAAPVPIEDALLNDPYLFDRVSSEGVVVAWAEPGETLAVVIGGSGGGGECIPQPRQVELAGAEGSATIRFDPPTAEACTADFRLHGWELALPSPVELDRVLPVELVGLEQGGDVLELEVGPDDLLAAGPTADPQPGLGQGDASPVAPAPIPAADMPQLDALPRDADLPVHAAWVEPGSTLAVFLVASGSEDCVPEPVAAWSDGPGVITVELLPPQLDAGAGCTADAVPYGWIFTLLERVPAELGVEVTVTGASPDDRVAVIALEPDDTVELG